VSAHTQALILRVQMYKRANGSSCWATHEGPCLVYASSLMLCLPTHRPKDSHTTYGPGFPDMVVGGMGSWMGIAHSQECPSLSLPLPLSTSPSPYLPHSKRNNAHIYLSPSPSPSPPLHLHLSLMVEAQECPVLLGASQRPRGGLRVRRVGENDAPYQTCMC
jgi:hypothetical protein